MPPSVSCSWHGRRRSHHTGCMSIASLAQSAMAGGGGQGTLQGCGMEGGGGGGDGERRPGVSVHHQVGAYFD